MSDDRNDEREPPPQQGQHPTNAEGDQQQQATATTTMTPIDAAPAVPMGATPDEEILDTHDEGVIGEKGRREETVDEKGHDAHAQEQQEPMYKRHRKSQSQTSETRYDDNATATATAAATSNPPPNAPDATISSKEEGGNEAPPPTTLSGLQEETDALIAALGDGGDDDDADLLGAVAGGGIGRAAITFTPPPGLGVQEKSLAELFGEHFQQLVDQEEEGGEEEGEAAAAVAAAAALAKELEDPEEVDVRSKFETLFGPNYNVEAHSAPFLIAPDNAAYLDENQVDGWLTHFLAEHEGEIAIEDVQEVISIPGARELHDAPPESFGQRFSVKFSTVPKNPLPQAMQGEGETLLLEFPRLGPNRQTVHFDAMPFESAIHKPPVTNARQIFTPQNVMRFAQDSATGRIASNSRVVSWSDGSKTLHIGSDVYMLVDAKMTGQLSLLASKTIVVTEEGEEKEGWVDSVPVNGEKVLLVPDGIDNSVSSFIIAEARKNRRADARSKVPLHIDGLPNFNVEKDKQPPKDKRPSMEEQFVGMRRKELEKRITKLKKTGERVSLFEQLQSEMEHFELLELARAEQQQKPDAMQRLLAGAQHEHEQKQHPHGRHGASAAAGKKRSGSDRFERGTFEGEGTPLDLLGDVSHILGETGGESAAPKKFARLPHGYDSDEDEDEEIGTFLQPALVTLLKEQQQSTTGEATASAQDVPLSTFAQKAIANLESVCSGLAEGNEVRATLETTIRWILANKPLDVTVAKEYSQAADEAKAANVSIPGLAVDEGEKE